MKQTARVKVKGSLTNTAVIGHGTRQECLLSPVLFITYAESMLRDALSDVNECIRVGGSSSK